MTCNRPLASDSSSFFRDYFGFVPRVFRAQSALPRVVEAEAVMAASVLGGGSLSQIEKERIVLATASALRNVYWATLSCQTLSVLGLTESELEGIMRGDACPYREPTHESLLVTAWASFVCSIATGLNVEPDFEPVAIPDSQARTQAGEVGRDLLRARSLDLEAALLASGFLTSAQRDAIELEATVAGRDGSASLDETGDSFVDTVRKLAASPTQFGSADLDRLRRHGFADGHIVETVVMVALTAFRDPANFVNPSRPDSRPSEKSAPADPDAELVARIQRGDVDRFEEIMERHSRRVYRTLIGVLGDSEQARDAMQDTFLKAYQHISGFQGRSKFSTWLVSIANNTAIQMLRDRCPEQSLSYDDSDEPFRPKEFRAWSDNPEQSYAKAELKALVEENVMKLPAKYRAVLMLKDIEQLSVEEVGSALGLGTAAVKSRVLRGRLMMREALAPHFAKSARGGAA
jgi:RNA polymerase sigma-70 factor (ECF subfamily)